MERDAFGGPVSTFSEGTLQNLGTAILTLKKGGMDPKTDLDDPPETAIGTGLVKSPQLSRQKST